MVASIPHSISRGAAVSRVRRSGLTTIGMRTHRQPARRPRPEPGPAQVVEAGIVVVAEAGRA